MGNTSWQVKRKYNSSAYGRIAVELPKPLAEAFKAKCKSEGTSMASVIKTAAENFINEKPPN